MLRNARELIGVLITALCSRAADTEISRNALASGLAPTIERKTVG